MSHRTAPLSPQEPCPQNPADRDLLLAGKLGTGTVEQQNELSDQPSSQQPGAGTTVPSASGTPHQTPTPIRHREETLLPDSEGVCNRNYGEGTGGGWSLDSF